MTEPHYKGFEAPTLGEKEAARLQELAHLARGDILTMTTLADSGHPGGSLSSIELYLTVWSYANTSPVLAGDPARGLAPDPGRDRVVVSHGHTSPGAYAALARLGYFDVGDVVAHFRQAGSIFEGHVERSVPGIEWSTGNLGQGLSAACGMALASRLTGLEFHTFCLMGDGGQAKGQIAEARRFAAKYGLTDLTALIDNNRVQQSGHMDEIMPDDLCEHWRAAGWKVLEIDGHDVVDIYAALHEAVFHAADPVAIVAHTVIGKGVPFMEDDYQWHGKALPEDKYLEAMAHLGLEPKLDAARKRRAAFDSVGAPRVEPRIWAAQVQVGEPRTYPPDEVTDNRSGWGAALLDIGDANIAEGGAPGFAGAPVLGSSPIAVFDCDLRESVKTDAFRKAHPDNFFEAGIQEHHTAAMAGALSTQGVLTFWADFGVFGMGETYNQNRLSDINAANVKLVLTHCGVDVGEDGKTHHCIDYLGVLRNTFGWRVLVPADPNQTDRAARWMAAQPGNVALCMGRSKLPVITRLDGTPAFAGDYRFEYGRMTQLRAGDGCALVVMGTMTHRAIRVHDILAERGVRSSVLSTATPMTLDDRAMRQAAGTGLIVTYEDHNPETGLGSSAALWLADARMPSPPALLRLGITRYESSGKPEPLFARQGLDPDSVALKILGMLDAN